MAFSDSGAIAITSDDGELAVHGTYKVTNDQIEFRDEGGTGACLGDLQIGQYSWELAGKVLTFTKVEDPCEGRANTLSSQRWEAQ